MWYKYFVNIFSEFYFLKKINYSHRYQYRCYFQGFQAKVYDNIIYENNEP